MGENVPEGVQVELVRHDQPEVTDSNIHLVIVTLRSIPGIYDTSVVPQEGGRFAVLFSMNPEYSHWLYILTRSLDHRYGGFGFDLTLHSHDLPPFPLYFALTERHTAFGREGACQNLWNNVRDTLAFEEALLHFGLNIHDPKKRPTLDPDGATVTLPDWTPLPTPTKEDNR
jgi:hypothetical protein